MCEIGNRDTITEFVKGDQVTVENWESRLARCSHINCNNRALGGR